MNQQPDFCGTPIIVSGPSGVGKGTIIKELIRRHSTLALSVSMTTRPPRPGERDGVDYTFVTHADFENEIQQGGLLEWAKVYENYYGTPKKALEKQCRAGFDVIVEIDVQGAASARMHYKDALTIYIAPPSLPELERRLYNRQKGDGDHLEQRLSLATREFQFIGLYTYVVINDEISRAVDDVERIVLADRLRRTRQIGHLRSMGILRDS
jgi:guanylate kinase